MLLTTAKLLKHAQTHGYAVPAFNINNLEILQAVVDAAVEARSPVILQTSEGAIAYAGMDYLAALVHTAIRRYRRLPIAFHLDHGKDLKLIRQVIRSGWYSSVMFDGSLLPYAENVRKTRQVVSLAHAAGLSVEAEIGRLTGIEDAVKVCQQEAQLTDPRQAASFAQATACDSLAIAIGTSHGVYKFREAPHLDLNRLRAIRQLVRQPLVLHGASEVDQGQVRLANRSGAKLWSARGVTNALLRQAVGLGICKVNIDTDLRLAFTAGIRSALRANPKAIDPRTLLNPAKEEMRKVALEKFRVLGSVGKV